jgi:ankyrin repeat protein
LLLHCHGRALFCNNKRSYELHKAVFDGNLHLISKLAKGSHDGKIYCDKNEIDSCGNTPLMLAIKLKKPDAVKVLTDLHCSSKLNPLPEILSAFELAKVQKDRELIEILMESELKLK